MSEPSDTTADFERALTESQKLEREERNADLERQARSDQRIAEVLAQHNDGSVTEA